MKDVSEKGFRPKNESLRIVRILLFKMFKIFLQYLRIANKKQSHVQKTYESYIVNPYPQRHDDGFYVYVLNVCTFFYII